jgi:hypothetical protein
MKPKKEYRQTEVTVRGRGTFPLDMLRYDRCIPTSESDTNRMHYPQLEYQIFKLYRLSSEGTKATAGRWKSFGWEVISDSGV